jgi:hypothetical protein
MAEPNLDVTRRGWVEKADDLSIGTALIVFLVFLIFYPLQERVGFWSALVIVILIGLALTVVITMSVVPLKRRRAEQDAKKGIFHCVFRERDSPSYEGRWNQGYAQAMPRQIIFQEATATLGTLSGSPRVYSGIRKVSDPTRAPWWVWSRGAVITMDTDNGEVELAATRENLNLLTERCVGLHS